MPEFVDVPRVRAAAPMGRESEWWRTVQVERTILVVARGPASALWVLDLLDEILVDHRIQVVFTVDEEVPDTFSRGLADISRIADAVAIPWSHAVAGSFDLAISASRQGGLHRLQCPLLLGPHGASIGKHDPVTHSAPLPVPDIGRRPGQGAATTVMIAHPSDRALLAPDQSDVDVMVTGDPCLDRLRASEPLREQYRRDLGIEPTQRLVLVTSTWGPDALMAAAPDIGTRLASELPVDRYRIALIVHPNIWTAHGIWQVNTWTRRSTSAGVFAIPPWRNAWRSALVASDVVIHDHGSVGLYAAALGKPMMVGRFDSALTVEGSPIVRLAHRAPRLDLDAPLQPQIDAAIAAHAPGRYDSIADRLSGKPGESLRLHRDLIYNLIGLDPPATEPRLLALARPPDPLPAIYSHHVRTSVSDLATVTVERFPAVTPPPPPPQRSGRRGGSTTSSPMSASPTPESLPTRRSSSTRRVLTRRCSCFGASPAAATRSPDPMDSMSRSGTRTVVGSGSVPAARRPTSSLSCSRRRAMPSRLPATPSEPTSTTRSSSATGACASPLNRLDDDRFSSAASRDFALDAFGVLVPHDPVQPVRLAAVLHRLVGAAAVVEGPRREFMGLGAVIGHTQAI